ncbi:MAG TPA: methyl-accepting chemotaxis protein [Bacilli bacterium]|nr:methyl-accepting chemotaxis protein [Bacilli bacterium]
MKLRTQTLGMLLLMALIPMIVMGFVSNYVSIKALTQTQDDAVRAAQESAVRMIEQQKQTTMTIADQVAADTRLQRALLDGDRTAMAQLLDPVFQRVSPYGVTVLEIGNGMGIVQYRAHNPTEFGDNKYENPIVSLTISTGKTVAAVEEGSSGLAVRGVAPIKSGNSVFGTITAGFAADDKMADVLKSMVGGEVTFYNASEKKAVVSTLKGEQDKLTDPQLVDTLFKDMKVVKQKGEIDGTSYDLVYIPLTDYDKFHTLGVMRLAISREAIVASEQENLIYTVALAVGVILLAILVSLRFTNRIVRALNSVVNGLQAAAQGTLREAEPVKASGELKQLREHYDVMVRNIRDLLHTAKDTASQVAELSEHLYSGAEEATATAEEISHAVEDVSKGSESQNDALQRANDSLLVVVRSLQEIAGKSHDLRTVTQEVDTTAEAGRGTMQRTRQEMNSIQEHVRHTADTMNRLGEQSQQIGHIVALIQGLAEQTNLLALNAAIEAARAGEQGRGFAVVADEVRKLAEQSGRAAEEIGDLLQDIRLQVEVSIDGMQQGLDAVASGEQAVADAEHAFQSVGDGLRNVTREVGEVNALTEEASEQAGGVESEFQAIAAVAEQSVASSEEVAASLEEQSATMTSLVHSMEHLSRLADELNGAVSKFQFDTES